MGAKETGTGRSVSQCEGDTSTFLESRHIQERSCVGFLLCEDGVGWIAAGDWWIRAFEPDFIAPGYARGYNTLSRDAHLLTIARDGQVINAFSHIRLSTTRARIYGSTWLEVR